MKITIFASIGCQNLGDELILKNEINYLEKNNSEEIKFSVFSYDKKNPFFDKKNIVYKDYFPIGSKKLKNIFFNLKNFFSFLKTIINSDMIIIGGGGLIYDKENQLTKNPLDLRIFRTNICRFFRKKIYFFRIGIDIKNEKNLEKVKKIFKNAYKIEVRDLNSKEVLDKLGIDSKVKLDPVFYDNRIIPTKSSCFRKRISFNFSVENIKDLELSGKTVGISFRSGYLVEKSNISERMEEGKIKELLIYLVGAGAKVTLLPHSFHKTDYKANDLEFLNKFVGNDNIEIKENMEDVYDVYKDKKIDLCISMRLHSMILCEVYNIPYIGVSYSTKTDEVLRTLKK